MAGNISALVEVYRMEELEKKTRANLIIKLGSAINYEFASNVTEPIVVELVKLLDPDNPILESEHYKRYLKEV